MSKNVRKLMDLYQKVEKAKQVQRANMNTEKIADYVGQTILVTGIEITEGVQINSLVLDKLTLITKDNKAISGFHKAGIESARQIIEIVGESPYEYPLIITIEAMETKWGAAYYPVLEGIELPNDFVPDLEEIPLEELEETTF